MILEKIKQSIIDGDQSAAEKAVADYIKPALDLLKSCSVFERNEAVREIINQTIQRYESDWAN